MSQSKINPNCPCTTYSCIRHGNCVECRKYHSQSGSSTACMKKSEKDDKK